MDGDLRRIFRQKLPHFHWQSIETGGAGRGVPDSNYCYNSIEGWIEFKQTSGWSVVLRPEQVAWLLRRDRAGGRSFVAVRRKTEAGPRKGPAVDELCIFAGSDAAVLRSNGIKNLAGHIFSGGPANWEWKAIEGLLLQRAPA